jgi:hypothetical protein
MLNHYPSLILDKFDPLVSLEMFQCHDLSSCSRHYNANGIKLFQEHINQTEMTNLKHYPLQSLSKDEQGAIFTSINISILVRHLGMQQNKDHNMLVIREGHVKTCFAEQIIDLLQVCITVLHTSPRVWVVSLMTSQMGWFD